MMQSANRAQALAAAKSAYQNVRMPEFQVAQLKKTIDYAKVYNQKRRRAFKRLAGLAAAIALFVTLPNASRSAARAMSGVPVLGSVVRLVTFRDYAYEDERHSAKIKTPELVVEGANNETLADTTAEINEEIARIADGLTASFREGLAQDGYLDVEVSGEVVAATEEYFTLRLICYQAAASGYEEVRYYTVDLATGKRLRLPELFAAGVDYITPISAEIKRQMREQMTADEGKAYWLDTGDPAWDFTAIGPETEFYLDAGGQLVISFNEGDVAPMYMGVLAFTIPDEIIDSIRK